MSHKIDQFSTDEQGATIVEFAVIASTLLLLIFFILQFGLMTYTQTMLERVTAQAGREASLGRTSNPDIGCNEATQALYVQCYVAKKMEPLLPDPENLVVQMQVSKSGWSSAITLPDICLTPTPHTGGTCSGPWEEHDNIPGYSTQSANNAGNSNDVVDIRFTYIFLASIPLVTEMFGDGFMTITSYTVVKNEPTS